MNATVLEFQDKITSFRMKIDNWLTKVERNNLYMFPTLNAFLQEGATNDCIDRPLQVLITEHIISLKNELRRYFPQTPGLSHTLVKTPFCSKVEDVNTRRMKLHKTNSFI